MASTAELISQAADQTRELIRDEFALAQAELERKGKQVAAGAGLFGGTAMLAFYAGATLVAAAVLGLATAMPAWTAALIVAGVLLLIGGTAALLGKRETRQALPPIPELAKAEASTTINTIKQRTAHESHRDDGTRHGTRQAR